MSDRALWPIAQIIALALWLGAAAFFAAAVAPALFAVLPSRTLAGSVVGRVLPIILYAGMVVGAVVIAAETARHRAWRWRGADGAASAMVAACAIAQFIIAPRIERVRAEIAGPLDSLAADDARRIAFGRLHGISVAWLGVAMLAAAVALVVLARALESRRS